MKMMEVDDWSRRDRMRMEGKTVQAESTSGEEHTGTEGRLWVFHPYQYQYQWDNTVWNTLIPH